MKLKLLDTPTMSARFRNAAIDVQKRRLLITYYPGSEQEQDLTEPCNCNGLGRIRHFKRSNSSRWVLNPLPIDPAAKALGLGVESSIRAQVFQNAVCNWRCWYCFVDFDLLRASPKHSRWVTPTELMDLYLAEIAPPQVIDLSGGQPDLTPEWVPWMMREIIDRGLVDRLYLWSDDNLSNDYLWRFLPDEDLQLISSYKRYARVCCFKGFDADSFSFNTNADPSLFREQFNLMRRLCGIGLDVYSYVTLTSPQTDRMGFAVPTFIDDLQAIDPNLPLRTVPLEVQVFTPVRSRIKPVHEAAIAGQYMAIELWQRELEKRFSSAERNQSIVDVHLNRTN